MDLRLRVRLRFVVSLLTGLLLATFSGVPDTSGASPRAPRGTGGAVASDDARATRVGLDILARGGNAVDAAVATALALAVTFPEAGNLGGGGFAVVRLPDGRLASLDFREVAPAAASRDMYLDENGDAVADLSQVGGLAVGVPGSPGGLYELHRRHGRVPWRDVVAPAARLARQGLVVDGNLHTRLEERVEELSRFPETARVWLSGGEPPPVGARIRFPELAQTLDAYARRGPEAITTGAVAEAVAAASRRHGGVLEVSDLSAYRPTWREPVTFDAFGWHWAVMGLPSSGGAILGQVAGVLEAADYPALPRFGAERAHLLAEAFRGAYADRFRLGDPRSAEVTEADLLAPSWVARRAGEIDPTRARVSDRVLPHARVGANVESQDTTHLSVVDARGGAVALTTTLNGLFGGKIWVPELGFLNNEMDDFAADPGRPNMFGLVQGEANAVRPGHRMLSSMSPTIVWRQRGEGGSDATEILAAGGRGGSRIPTNTLQVLLAAIEGGDHLQLAMDRPRLHHQWLPDLLEMEPDALSPEAREVLHERGHTLEFTDRTAKVNAVRGLRETDGGPWLTEAAADPRGTGEAGGAGVVWPEPLVPRATALPDRPDG
jgi:gamma-glutamyltranspeptidase/glutathione hydrolase